MASKSPFWGAVKPLTPAQKKAAAKTQAAINALTFEEACKILGVSTTPTPPAKPGGLFDTGEFLTAFDTAIHATPKATDISDAVADALLNAMDWYGSQPLEAKVEFFMPSDYAARVAAFRDNLTKPASPSPGKPAGRIFTLDDE